MKKQGILLLAVIMTALLCGSAMVSCTQEKEEDETQTTDTVDTTVQEQNAAEETDEPEETESKEEDEATLDFSASISEPITGKTMSYPAHWDEIGIVSFRENQYEKEPEYKGSFYLQEKEANDYWMEKSGDPSGYVWSLSLLTKDATFAWEKGAEGACTVNGTYLIGEDEDYYYTLYFPTGVEWLMDNEDVNKKTTSEIKYKQLMNESEEVLAHFLEENGITPNELCPLSDIYLLHCWKEEA